MNHISFGSTLKEARIAKGYDINTVARRLRIRPDILQAIEESDFERIPPRGYARNMINSYAHLLGLDANEVTRMYLDEAYANSVGVAHGSMSEMRAQQRATASQGSGRPGRTSSFNRVDSESGRSRYSSEGGGQVNGLGRRTYALEMEDKISGGANRTAAAKMGMGSNGNGARTPHPSNRSALQDGRYLNAVEGRSSSAQIDFRRYLPFVLGGLIVVIVLFIVLNLTVCHQQEPAETIPVTNEQGDSSSTDSSTSGTDSTSSDGSSTESTTTSTEKAPTEFTLSYKIADGVSTYLEIKVDGKYVVASDVTGPKSGEYTSSDTIQFVSSNSKGLTVSIDGEEQKIKENSSGIYNKTFKFSDVLKQWNKDHPDAASSSSSKSSSSSSKDSTSTSSTSSKSATSSTTSSTSSDDASASSGSSPTSDSSSTDTLSVTGSSTTSVGSSGSSSDTSSSSSSND